VFHQVAYQLIVTHCSTAPIREHPPNGWELRNPGFNGQNAAKTRYRH
jgi:hypothetical protein